VKGLLANLISIKDVTYATGLEVVAGGRLYNIVVDTEVGVCACACARVHVFLYLFSFGQKRLPNALNFLRIISIGLSNFIFIFSNVLHCISPCDSKSAL